MSDERMRRFWNARAAENAMYYIDNRLEYTAPDPETFWEHGRHELDLMLGAIGAQLAPEHAVVEIGCGAGRMTHTIAQRVATVRALDISPEMLDNAREHERGLENVEWILGSGTDLAPIADESADVCLSHVVFQHIPDPEITLGYIREIGRVLRQGGWAAFQVSNDPSIHRRRTGREGLRIFLRGLLRRGPRGQTDPAWLGSYVELDALRAAARQGGMAVEQVAGEGTQLCFVLTRKDA